MSLETTAKNSPRTVQMWRNVVVRSRHGQPLGYSERGVGELIPHLNPRFISNYVFAKYTVQTLLLYSLNPKFLKGKLYTTGKLYTNFTLCFIFCELSSPVPLAWPPPREPPPL